MTDKRPHSALLRANDGITTIEFAMITPVMLLLVAGIIEFSLIMFTMTVMESSTLITARMGKTGYVEDGMSRQQMIVSSINGHTAGLLDPNLITIQTQVYSFMNNVNDPEPFTDSNGNGIYNLGEPFTDINGSGSWDEDMAASGLGNANDIVVYTVSYPWVIQTPIVSTILGPTFPITVRTVVKNEPYDS